VFLIQTTAAATKITVRPVLHAGTVALSSALVFVVQPMMAKALLPRFGGSAAVWIACLLFFQVALLLGYLYAFCLTRYLGVRAQALAHLAVMAVSIAALPLRSRLEGAGYGPTASILLMLAASVGAPYFVLSATSPLVQSWLAASRGKHFPYRLFALSNAASLAALLAYPAAIEPFLSTQAQMAWWSGGYVALLCLMAVAAARNLRSAARLHRLRPISAAGGTWLWLALAACASTMWMAVSNYLGQQVAAMPFLWVAPMTVYLLSFILCFESDGWYRPALFRWLMPVAWLAICSRLVLESSAGGLKWEIPVFSAALFVCCMFCHGELALRKPAPEDGLAFFYLVAAAGGAVGGVFVALAAPHLFPTFLELPIGVTASVFLALYCIFGYRSTGRLIRLAVVAAATFVVTTQFQGERRTIRTRNFYGALQVRETGEGATAVRTLYSGRTIHGLELLSPDLQRTATTYYGAQSGAGLALASTKIAQRRVAIVGLGAGTLATYGRRGDFFRFYEINPAVIDAAASFDFLRNSRATIDVVRGDGRLMLEREPAGSFDVVALDAFSDDAIPVHLLTRQSFAMYFDRLKPDGLLLIHLTNRYLDLSAEVEALAATLGKSALFIDSARDPARGIEFANWAILGGSREILAEFEPYARPLASRKVRAWTDEYSSLMQLWK
jgi:SAM-dependent methyltransferase